MRPHSILVYTRNHAPHIAECIESLLAQTDPRHEIIVYDDGSTDDTDALLHSYGRRLRVIVGPRRAEPDPVAEARGIEAALAQAEGRLIFLLWGDERFKPHKIERYAAEFEANPDTVLVQAPIEQIDPQGRTVGVSFDPLCHVTNHLREAYRRQDLNFFYAGSALAFSRYYLERVLPLDLSDRLPVGPAVRLCIPAPYYGRIITLPDALTESRRPADTPTEPHSPVHGIFMRAQLFNRFCRQHHLRTISPWRNPQLYLQLLRYALPARPAVPGAQALRPAVD